MAASDLITSINTTVTNIANAIRAKTGSQSTIPFANLPSAVDDVYDAGINAMWDAIQNNGNRNFYEYGFRYWNCEYLRPKYKVISGNYRSLYMFAYNSSLKKIEARYFDLSGGKTSDTTATDGHYYTFADCGNLEEIEDIGMKAGYYTNTFANCSKLHTIAKLRVNATTKFSNAFLGCQNLENITIDGTIGESAGFSSCVKLSRATIEGIFACLSTTASGKTIYLSQTAVNNAFTQAEWDTLKGTRNNWTVSLS